MFRYGYLSHLIQLLNVLHRQFIVVVIIVEFLELLDYLYKYNSTTRIQWIIKDERITHCHSEYQNVKNIDSAR